MGYTAEGLVLWPLLPNWKRAISEALEFRTRVLGPTLTGLRQKRRMRLAPRRSFAFEVHPHHQSRRLLDTIRFSQGKLDWALPVWPDRQSLAATLPVASTSVPCLTAGYDFAVGRYAVLRKPSIYTTEFEIVQIDSIDPGAINLVAETEQEWPVGTHLFPLRAAKVSDNGNSASLYNGEVSTLSVDMDVSEVCDWPEYEFPTLYRGRPVWEFGTDWRQNRNFAFNRIINTVDNDTSLPAYFDLPNKTFASMDVLWRAKHREEHTLVRSVLYALAGRYKSLWVATYTDDLEVVSSISAVSTSLIVQYCGYTLFGLAEEGRKDIRIELRDGTIYYRRVVASGELGDTEQLVLDSALGENISPENIRRVSFIMLMQQASDSITLTHLTDADGVTTLPVVLEGVVEPPSEV
jgi:hypothetical protein